MAARGFCDSLDIEGRGRTIEAVSKAHRSACSVRVSILMMVTMRSKQRGLGG
jgi:hypothetical protein